MIHDIGKNLCYGVDSAIQITFFGDIGKAVDKVDESPESIYRYDKLCTLR